MKLSQDQLLEIVQAFPLHKQFDFRVLDAGEGRCHAQCTIGPAHINLGGVVHGGVMYLLLDVAAYCAALTVLPPGLSATTHDIHVSVLRPTPPGVTLDLHGVVRKAGKSVYFIDAEASVDGKLMASARVTKSVIPMFPEDRG